MSAGALLGAAFGAVAGPPLAGLGVSIPAGQRARQLYRGSPAGRGRIASMTCGAVAVCGLLGARVGIGPALLAFCWLGATGVALAVIDVQWHRLPDVLVFPAYAVGVFALLAAGDVAAWLRAVLAMVVVFGVLVALALISPAGLGFGDVKLGGLLGLHLGWLGWPQVLAGIVGGFVLAAFGTALLLVTRRITLRSAVPLGPALLSASLLSIVTS